MSTRGREHGGKPSHNTRFTSGSTPKGRRKTLTTHKSVVTTSTTPKNKRTMPRSRSIATPVGGMLGDLQISEPVDDLPAERRQRQLELEAQAELDTVTQDYIVGKVLGTGSFGVVRLVEHRQTASQFALKIMNKKDPKITDIAIPEQQDRISKMRNEIKLLSSLNHPNIVKLIESFESPNSFYLVMELLSGGEVMEKLSKCGKYTENDAKDVIRAVILGIEYLHSKGYVHRDLKPQNIMLDDSDVPKIADFGLSVRGNKFRKEFSGTPLYIAPEILTGVGAEKGSDMWSMGCITYQLLCGNPPFMPDKGDGDLGSLFNRIVEGVFKFNSDSCSDQAKDFVKKLLVVNPVSRWTASEALAHPWLKIGGGDVVLPGTVQDMMRSFMAEQRLKKGQLGVLGMIRFKSLKSLNP